MRLLLITYLNLFHNHVQDLIHNQYLHFVCINQSLQALLYGFHLGDIHTLYYKYHLLQNQLFHQQITEFRRTFSVHAGYSGTYPA